MRPNISNCHALPGTLIIFEWADGSGKTTQIKSLKKLLEKEGHEVTVSAWKTAPIIWSFLTENEAQKKMDERILPETNLFLQTADLLYRIEREVIPALKKNHIVILDRGVHTLIVRGLIIGMSEVQIRTGLLWWRNTLYKELFDKAYMVHITINTDESLKRLKKRMMNDRRKKDTLNKKKVAEGTLLTLHYINNLVYAPDGKKMTRNDKKIFVQKTQAQIIDTYNSVFREEKHSYIEIDGTILPDEITRNLKEKVVDMIV
jgi:thymidylate kinase